MAREVIKLKKNIKINRRNILSIRRIKLQNCYSFSMNLNNIRLNLGEISNSYPNYVTDFVDSFISDCKALDLNVNEVEADYDILDENEWLIALYGASFQSKLGIFGISVRDHDYHFIRKRFKESKWCTKLPNDIIRHKDSNNNPIINPKDAIFYVDNNSDNLQKYDYYGTYLLRKN